MGYAKSKIKYPCGLEVEMVLKAFGGKPEIQRTNDLEEKGCPLHGKDCLKKTK